MEMFHEELRHQVLVPRLDEMTHLNVRRSQSAPFGGTPTQTVSGEQTDAAFSMASTLQMILSYAKTLSIPSP
jgi:hypothetical protein